MLIMDKDRIQEIFVELANERYDKEYWELSESIQYDLYIEAESLQLDEELSKADMLNDE
jgi:hypothetical protein